MKNKVLVLVFVLFYCKIAVSKNITFENFTDDSIQWHLHNDTILVGLKISPPFTMKNVNGEFEGVSVELWESIARSLGVHFIYKEYDLKNLLQAIENGEVDLCISPLTVTSERLTRFNFTQPFYTSTISIAVKGQKKSFALLLLSNVFSLNFLKAILALVGVVFILGLLLWLAERKKNPQIAENFKGIGDGIWWAAVTMTTVGYGDKTPISPLGRGIALFWMFLSIIIISSLTASITTALTMERISTSIDNFQDLVEIRTATLEGSSTETYFWKKGAKTIGLKDIDEGMNKLVNDEIDAFVYDEPILRYVIQQKNLDKTVRIVEHQFNSQYYSFALPNNHYLLDLINPLLIKELEGIRWKGILNNYNLSQE